MVTVQEMREGLAANVRASLDGFQVLAYALSSPTPPAVQILPAETVFDLAFGRGVDRWGFTIQAFVGFTNDVSSQKLLDETMNPTGARSIKTAVESDPTLGGKVDNVRVLRTGGYRLLDSPSGAQLILVEFPTEVIVTN